MKLTTCMAKDVSILTKRPVLVLILLLFSTFPHVNAQSNYLKQKISIDKNQISLKNALVEIENIGGFNFSYNVTLFNGDSIVDVKYNNTSIAKILDQLFNQRLNYKIIGKHVVLVSAGNRKSKRQKKEITGYTITGYIIDAQTGRKIRSATIYDINGNVTAITDKSGFYKLSIPEKRDSRTLSYCKNGYQDTIIIIKPINKKIDILLQPTVPSVNKIASKEAILDTSANKTEMKIDWIVSDHLRINAENLEIYEHRPGQISFLPLAGSNGKISGAVINNFSLNVLAGYADGVDGVEIGGIINIDRSYVNGVQVAGIANVVGKYMTGVQVAGITNKNVGSIKGVQIAGINNIVNDTITGAQIAGFSNILKGKMNGLQLAGFHNHTTKDVEGMQIAGFVNTANQDVVLMQLTGFYNYCKNVNGIQIAGFYNQSDNLRNGIQLAGFLNNAKDIKGGVQLAGFLNIGRKVDAVQIGIVNICDTTSGISIGLYNHIKKGYRAIEFSSDEVFPTNFSFIAGTKKFYNIYNFGLDPSNPKHWSIGAGFGSIWKLGKMVQFNLEVTSNAVNETKTWEDELNLRNKIDPSLELICCKRLSLSAGPALNIHISAITDPETGDFSSSIAENSFYDSSFRKNKVQMWLGFNATLRFIVSKNT